MLERLDADVLADVDVVLEADARDRGLHLAVEHVAIGGQVLAEAADVLPVAVGDRAEERLAELEQLGEQLLAEVVGLARRDVVEDLGFEHVDAGVDGVREHLPPGRLFEEALDPALVVDHHDAELERVLDVLQTIVTMAPRRSCSATTAVRSKSVSASPEITMKRSPSSSSAFLTLPAVPRGTCSTE